MRIICGACGVVLLLGVLQTTVAGADRPAAIERVEIRAGRVFEVNGRPYFPLMAWLQDPANFAAVKACGMNTTAGYWPGSGGTKNVAEYLGAAEKAGLYGVMPWNESLKGRPNLLGYIHDDEPDLPHQVNDARIVPGGGLTVNRKTPLWKLVDGVTHTWSVLDPLEGAELTIRLKKPVTIVSLAVWPTISKGLPVAKEVSFEGDGRKILEATLKAAKGQQKFPFLNPVTFSQLKLTVASTHAGEQVWGSIGEIEGFNAAGENVLLSPPRYEPRAQPAESLKKYRAVKAGDPSRPVFMTLTGYFHPHFGKWTDAQRHAMYPEYIKATDVVGYDIYPIYGWNKPEWIHLVHEATDMLVKQAGERPVYAWIETSRGGQYTGPLERQHDVTPVHIRAEVWMAICRGATAIGYFTHVWKPSYKQFGVPPENRRALREINDQITRLAPAILAARCKGNVSIRAESDVKIDAMARQFDGSVYVFAVNYDQRQAKAAATITVEGLPVGSQIEVIDEARTIRSEAGKFTDTFDPLAVHVYRVVGQGSP